MIIQMIDATKYLGFSMRRGSHDYLNVYLKFKNVNLKDLPDTVSLPLGSP